MSVPTAGHDRESNCRRFDPNGGEEGEASSFSEVHDDDQQKLE